MRRIALLTLALSQPGCIVVGGYSSERGWYIWPGSLISILVVVVLLFILSRRRRR